MTAPMVYSVTREPWLTPVIGTRAVKQATRSVILTQTPGQLWWRLGEVESTRELRAKLAAYEALLDAAGIER